MATKTDCYFYEEVQDMGARFSICNYPADFEKKCCKKCDNCKQYFSKKMADSAIRTMIEEALHLQNAVLYGTSDNKPQGIL